MKIKKIIFNVGIFAVLLINISVVSSKIGTESNLSLNSLFNLSIANAENGDCQPPCAPGYGCVNGVCVQREAATRTACTTYVFCWKLMKYVSTPGHQTKCPANPGGVLNCLGSACKEDADPCT